MFLPSSIYLFIKWVLYSSIWGHSTGVSSFRETDFRWEPFIWQHSRSSMAREWCLSRGHADSSLPHVPHTLTSEEPQELSVSPGLFQWLVGGGVLRHFLKFVKWWREDRPPRFWGAPNLWALGPSLGAWWGTSTLPWGAQAATVPLVCHNVVAWGILILADL